MNNAWPVIDTHVHLWNPEQFSMPWLAEAPDLCRPYGLADYWEQTQGLPISALVFVETGVEPQQAFREAQHIVELARAEPRLAAIVAAAPLEDGQAVREHLAALTALSPLIKGVRRNIQDETDPDFCLRPAFLVGARLLAEFGLSFDLCLKSWQLPAATALARACPDTTFVLDHLGKPVIKQQQLDPWQTHLRQLAELPNVACKLSGMVTEAEHTTWQPADLEPFLAVALDAFGEDRILFGSDWPVALLASSYTRWYTTLATLTAHLPPATQRKLWSENARRWYRIDQGQNG